MQCQVISNKPLKISIGSGKMQGIRSINTNPFTNDFCNNSSKMDTVCQKCYSRRFLSFRVNNQKCFQVNNELLIKKNISIPKLNDNIFRFNSHGELINSQHLINLMAVVNSFPKTVFSLWTKRIDIVKRYLKNNVKPDNLILIRSSLKLNKPDRLPPQFDKVFTVYSDKADINCPKNCMDCLKCYNQFDSTIFINEKLK